jgi:hypothetical protein
VPSNNIIAARIFPKCGPDREEEEIGENYIMKSVITKTPHESLYW